MKEWKLALKEINEVDRLPQTKRNDWEYKEEAKNMRAKVEKKLK